MVLAFEIAVGIALALAALAWLTAWRGTAEPRWLARLTLVLALAALAGAGGLVAALIGDGDGETMAICLGALALAALAALGAASHVTAQRRAGEVEAMGLVALRRIDERLQAHAALRSQELERTLARERAETVHLLVSQERELAEARRFALETQATGAGEELAARVGELQARHEQRLTAWTADLERAQRELRERLEQLIREQVRALAEHEQRLAEHGREVELLSRHRRDTAESLRASFSQDASGALESARVDLEAHAAEQRRALAELSDRLRALAQSLQEDAQREEADARARLASTLPDVERRIGEQLERSLQRAVDRLVEEAERRFDTQIKLSREETAKRLSHELERAMDNAARAAERDVEARMSEVAQSTTRRLQRDLDQVVRGAETQTGVAEERIAFLTDRLEKALDDAAGRLAAFEADVELQLTAKLGEVERALRQAEASLSKSVRSHS